MNKILLTMALMMPVLAQASSYTPVVIGAAHEEKLRQCTLASQYAEIAGTIKRTSGDFGIYMSNAKELTHQYRIFPNAGSIAIQTGRYVFDHPEVAKGETDDIVYRECVKHPEKFRVVY